MPSHSYKITADHPILSRFDKTVWIWSEMIWWKNQLKEADYCNINIVQTDLETLNQIVLPV